jgi:hypothetical protein
VSSGAAGAGKGGRTAGKFNIRIVVGVVIGILVLIALAILFWRRARPLSAAQTDEATSILYASLTCDGDGAPMPVTIPNCRNEMRVEVVGGNHLNSLMSIDELGVDDLDELL